MDGYYVHSQVLDVHSQVLDVPSQVLDVHSQVLDVHSQVLDVCIYKNILFCSFNVAFRESSIIIIKSSF